jgi:DNA-binding PadR family transcriptional regulator
MNRTNLGEFEELVLLIVGILGAEAYGVGIMEEIERQTGRPVNISAVHTALHRLEEKGFLASNLAGASSKRGGRRKRIFQLTHGGKLAINNVKELRNRLWNQIPDLAISNRTK